MNISECSADYTSCIASDESDPKRFDDKIFSESCSWTCDSSYGRIDQESLLSDEDDVIKASTSLNSQYFVISSIALVLALIIGPAIGPIIDMVEISSTVAKLSWRNQGALINCVVITLVIKVIINK